MGITAVGPWVLLALGAATCLANVWVSVRGKPTSGRSVQWVFGVLLAGVGVYGPAFLGPYRDFIDAVKGMARSPGKETYARAIQAVADGDFPAEYQEVILTYALERPIPRMDSLLTSAVEQARPDTRQALADALVALRGKQRVADVLAREVTRAPNPVGQIEKFDGATASLVARRVEALHDTTLRRLNTSRQALSRFGPVRPPLAGQKP